VVALSERPGKEIRKFLARLVLAGLVVLADLGCAGTCAAASPAVACSPDRPTVVSGDSITVRVWLESSPPGLRYDWTATGGNIKGRDAEAVWDFQGVTPGVYESTVTATDPRKDRVACTVQVIVREHSMGGSQRTTWRNFLIKGQREKPGYGLYSYLLFGSPPDDSSRDRYSIAVDVYLRQILEIVRLEDEPSVSLSELNVTHLPVTAQPPADVSVDWVLAHYDYATARLMLAKLPGTYMTGPYFISVLKPLLTSDTVSAHYLRQNLSTVPTVPKDLIYWWVREFQGQAAQERFWEERTGQQLALKLRTIVAAVAVAMPEVRKGLDTAITWVR
jgi:hypothetical protein